MKRDELKVYGFCCICDFKYQGTDRGQSSNEMRPYYSKSEVDEAIAELKEFAEDACLERDDNQTAIDELNEENRRLKRALWLARAECAKWKSLYYWYAVSRKHDSRMYDEVEHKCRAKAEEYK